MMKHHIYKWEFETTCISLLIYTTITIFLVPQFTLSIIIVDTSLSFFMLWVWYEEINENIFNFSEELSLILCQFFELTFTSF